MFYRPFLSTFPIDPVDFFYRLYRPSLFTLSTLSTQLTLSNIPIDSVDIIDFPYRHYRLYRPGLSSLPTFQPLLSALFIIFLNFINSAYVDVAFHNCVIRGIHAVKWRCRWSNSLNALVSLVFRKNGCLIHFNVSKNNTINNKYKWVYNILINII